MENLIEILKKILISYDFNITSEYPHYVMASKEGSNVVAAALQAKGILTTADVLALKNEMPPDLDKIIFVTTSEIDQELEDFAREENILLWGKKRLEEEIGRAVLSGVEGEFRGERLLDEIEGKRGPPSTEETREIEAQIPSEAGPIEVRIEPKLAEEDGELIMKPRITMSEVSEISKKIVQGFRLSGAYPVLCL